jgi:hypothetical protein
MANDATTTSAAERRARRAVGEEVFLTCISPEVSVQPDGGISVWPEEYTKLRVSERLN